MAALMLYGATPHPQIIRDGITSPQVEEVFPQRLGGPTQLAISSIGAYGFRIPVLVQQ